VKKRSEGLSILLVDLRDGRRTRPDDSAHPDDDESRDDGVVFDDLEVPAALVGEEGKGFRYLLDGLNAERILIAAECVGDGRWFIERATKYANDRVVFGRPIGQNQGVQFPIARAHVNVEAADLMRDPGGGAVRSRRGLRRRGQHGQAAGRRRLVGSGQRRVQTYGGFGFAEDYDIERKFRENEAVPGGAHFDEPDPVVSSARACWDCHARTEAELKRIKHMK
jgi:acyl-CoA dehydrogenase